MSKLHTSKIVIALDGNVNVGKTTFLIKQTDKFGLNYIPEHSEYLNNIPDKDVFSNHEMNVHQRFMQTDELRIKDLIHGINLIDRSFVSFSAFAFALWKTGQSDIRNIFLKEFQKLLFGKKIIVPNTFMHFKEKHSIANNRHKNNNQKKLTPVFLIEKDFYNYFDIFCEKWMEYTDGITISHASSLRHILSNCSDKKISDDEIFFITKEILKT